MLKLELKENDFKKIELMIWLKRIELSLKESQNDVVNVIQDFFENKQLMKL